MTVQIVWSHTIHPIYDGKVKLLLPVEAIGADVPGDNWQYSVWAVCQDAGLLPEWIKLEECEISLVEVAV
jgi:hypothetical protein